jgi:DNA-binding protein H-NS
MGKMGKMNVNAMESKLNKQMKMAKMRERCKEKAQLNAKMKEQQQQQHSNIENKPSVSEEELLKIFNSTDKPERTPRNATPNQSNKNKNKKNKNK